MHCNGKCHLTQQLNLSQDNSGKNTGRILVLDSFIPLYYQVAEYEIPLIWIINKRSENWKKAFLHESTFSDIPYPPPKIRLYNFT